MSSTRIQNVSETYSKDGYLYKDSPGSHLQKIYDQCTKSAKVTKVFKILVSHFSALFRGCLQRRI